MKKQNLNGKYSLKGFENGKLAVEIEANVPECAQISLCNSGILPKDIYFGENIKLLERYELFDWEYNCDFEVCKDFEQFDLFFNFDGVDTVAEYFVNGQKIGESENMLVGHRFAINEFVHSGKNELTVKIASPIKYAHSKEQFAYMVSFPSNFASMSIRQAPHMYGWDIMCRAVTSGIWRDVSLLYLPKKRIENFYFNTYSCDKNGAWIWFNYDLNIEPEDCYQDMQICLAGKCGDSSFSCSEKVNFKSGTMRFCIDNPKLWNVRGYGEQNLYDCKLELIFNGEVLHEKNFIQGICKVEVIVKKEAQEDGFVVKCNGNKVFCKGTNHVPIDAFHCRDKERLKVVLEKIYDSNCNIVRCWGGNVYECDEFFDYCDKHGILVWQDFAMACSIYPMNESFRNLLQDEVKKLLLRIRNHACIALFAGDNEVDYGFNNFNFNPENNILTRKLIKETLFAYHPFAFYLPSSPHISPHIFESKKFDAMPEEHLWGARDYFKSKYYSDSKASFISEIGYHGCPNLSSIKKFISEENILNLQSEECILHCTSPTGTSGPFAYRNQLMENQVKMLFNRKQSDFSCLEDFILASQISQAEADKFFIETSRKNKWQRGGIIWWNIMDGCPQFSDAVCDYYGENKLAYYYIRESQQDVLISMCEFDSWGSTVMVVNDTLQSLKGRAEICCNGKLIASTKFECAENGKANIMRVPITSSANEMYLLKVILDNGRVFKNHFYSGFIPYDFDIYKKALKQLSEFYGTFDFERLCK